MELRDKQLINKYLNGQVAALEELVEKYKGPLFGYIINMTEGKEDADEIFQEVWLKVIKKISVFKCNNFGGWLMRIARNRIIDRARKKKPYLTLDEENEQGIPRIQSISGTDPGAEISLEVKEIKDRISEAIRTLPDDQKEVFVMRTVSGLSFKDIARAQKVSINTALARMQYAMEKMRPILKDTYEEMGR